MPRNEEDEEKQPLLPRKRHENVKRAKWKIWSTKTVLKRCRPLWKGLLLKLDMASMQSPRTQCCCCAVGVFAAMFGIFMLSAGICIVLNVQYMEVDTSGLPPDLHNEDGKRIVGIILICVSLCTLGLSATVSIIYFALCNRSPKPKAAATSATTSSNGHAPHAPPTHQSTHSNSTHHHHHHHHHSSKGAAKLALHKTGNGAKGTPTGSQSSLNTSAKQRRHAASASGVLLPTPSHGQSPSSGTKRGQGRRNIHHKRHKMSNRLPTHTEEDPEAAKSVVDLKSHNAPSADSSSNSGSSNAPSTTLGSTITDDPRGATFSTTSFITTQASPVIVINEPTQNTPYSALKPGNTSGPSLEHLNFEDGDTAAEKNTLYHENEIARTVVSGSNRAIPYPPPPQPSSYEVSRPLGSKNSKDSSSYTNPVFQNDSNVVPLSIKRFDADDPSKGDRFSPSPPPSTSTQQTAFPQYCGNGTMPINTPQSDPDLTGDLEKQTADTDSVGSSTNHSILQVKPQPSLEFDPDDYIQTPVVKTDPTADKLITELPPSSRHNDRYQSNPRKVLDEETGEDRCESRSSFNSAFSADTANDSEKDDRERVIENLQKLVD